MSGNQKIINKWWNDNKNRIGIWQQLLETILAGIPKRMVPPPGKESKMLSKEGESNRYVHLMSRAQISFPVIFRKLATQTAAHISKI